MNRELVTIITPIYNGEKYLDRYFECLKNITYKNLEIILIDDGSRDKSYAKIKKYESQYKYVKVIKKDNAGVSAARNDGINIANGKYLFFFDCDDTFEPSIIETCVQQAENVQQDTILYNVADVDSKGIVHQRIMTYCKSDYFAEDIIQVVGKSLGISIDELYEYLKGKRKSRESKERNGPWRMMYSLEIIKQNNIRFCENIRIGEDTIFGNEYLCYSKHVGVIPKTLYYCYDNSDSATHVYAIDYNRVLTEKIKILKEKANLTDRIKKNCGFDLQNVWGGECILSTIQLMWLIAGQELPLNKKIELSNTFIRNKAVKIHWNRLENKKLFKIATIRSVPVILLKLKMTRIVMYLLYLMKKMGFNLKE